MCAASPCSKSPSRPGANHVEDQQFFVAVVAIFHDHAMPPRLLGCVHQRLAFFQSVHCRNFHAAMLSCVHGCQGHRRVPIPRRGDVDEVQIVAFAQIFEVMLSVVVSSGRFPPAFSTSAWACSVFSFTMSQMAFTCTCSIARKFESMPVPRPPTPMMPIRTFSRGSNFESDHRFVFRRGKRRPL